MRRFLACHYRPTQTDPVFAAIVPVPPAFTAACYPCAGRYRVQALPANFEANAVNSKGEIAGTWSAGIKTIEGLETHVSQAAVWQNNRLTKFPYTNDQPMAAGNAISDDSDIGGEVGLTLGEPISFQYDAFFWSLPSLKSHCIGHLPDLSCAHLLGINSHKEGVGWCTGMGVGEPIPEGHFADVTGDELGGTVGFYWADPLMFNLGQSSAAYAINERGQAVGVWQGHITLWQNGERRFLGQGRAFAINKRGWIAGEKDEGTVKNNHHDWPRRRAFVWQGKGSIKDLPYLPGDAISKARSVNDRGQVVGASFRLREGNTPASMRSCGRQEKCTT